MSPVGVTLKINHLQQCRWFFRVLFSARFPSVFTVCVNQCVNRIFPMNTTIEAVLYTSKTLSNGQHPIMLRLTKNRKRKYISLHISLAPQYWDAEKCKPRRNCPDKERIETLIQQKTKELQSWKIQCKLPPKTKVILPPCAKIILPP